MTEESAIAVIRRAGNDELHEAYRVLLTGAREQSSESAEAAEGERRVFYCGCASGLRQMVRDVQEFRAEGARMEAEDEGEGGGL